MTKDLNDYFADWEGLAFGYGYGSGEQHILAALKTFMAAIGGPEQGSNTYDYRHLERACGPTVAWLLINLLCEFDVIEYGSSPRFAWLSPEGVRLKEFIDARTAEQLIDIVCKRPTDYAPCYPDVCNCGPNYPHGPVCVYGPVCPNPFWPNRKPKP